MKKKQCWQTSFAQQFNTDVNMSGGKCSTNRNTAHVALNQQVG
jgi:hypothetical protein